uniref:Uncharacterized protein n=1 Tax=Lepeophtheirus salmonis TaxID=72036 RepID=A0A0K2UKQ1_LEPSM
MPFKMYHSGVLIDQNIVSHITSEGKINTIIQAINLASFLGAKEELNQTKNSEDILNELVKFLNSSEIEPTQASKLSFILEQMALLSPNQHLKNIHPLFFQPQSCGRM